MTGHPSGRPSFQTKPEWVGLWQRWQRQQRALAVAAVDRGWGQVSCTNFVHLASSCNIICIDESAFLYRPQTLKIF